MADRSPACKSRPGEPANSESVLSDSDDLQRDWRVGQRQRLRRSGAVVASEVAAIKGKIAYLFLERHAALRLAMDDFPVRLFSSFKASEGLAPFVALDASVFARLFSTDVVRPRASVVANSKEPHPSPARELGSGSDLSAQTAGK
jgi:hypothetical protein